MDNGLRIAELCSLQLLDVGLENRKIRVVVKGGDQKPGWFGETTKERSIFWLRVRLAAPGVHSLFARVGGVTPANPRRYLKKDCQIEQAGRGSVADYSRGAQLGVTGFGVLGR